MGLLVIVITVLALGATWWWATSSRSITAQEAFEVLVGDKAPSDAGHLAAANVLAAVGWLAVPTLIGTLAALLVDYRIGVVQERREAAVRKSREKR